MSLNDKGSLLRSLRLQHGYTLDDVGDHIGTSKQTLYKYENNIITNIPSDKIEALAALYGVSPAHIMGWEDLVDDSSKISKGAKTSVDSLSTDEQDLIQKYRLLTPEGKETVNTILDIQYKAVMPKVKNEDAI